MEISFRHVALPTACAVVALLSACGGGGGGGGATTTSSVTLTPAAQLNLGLADTFGTTALTGDGSGLWSGSGGSGSDSGSADAGGSAGDGEFVKVSVKFPGSTSTSGVLTWTILRSAYGLEGKSGTMTLQADNTSGVGGYKVTAGGGTNQSNIFVSTSGQITGSLPLPISSGPDSIFAGTRFNDSTAPSLATYAGTYTYASISAAKGTGANANLDAGILYLTATGLGRICPNQNNVFGYSATCTQGTDIIASFDSSANNVLRFKQSSTQATQNAITNNAQLDLIGVAKAVSTSANPSGMVISGDFINYNTIDGYRTGAVYAARQGNSSGSVNSTFQPSDLATPGTPSYWNMTIKDTKTGKGAAALLMFADVGGGIVKRSVIQAGVCNATGSLGFTKLANNAGALVSTIRYSGSPDIVFGVVQSDVDGIVVAADTSLALGRRTISPAVISQFANCQPQ